MKLRFYLDSLGDSIELFNNAEIHTNVPKPSALSMAMIVFLSFHVRRPCWYCSCLTALQFI